jgi:hypothetical protein
VAYTLTPAALCTAGFCAPGIAGSSFAAWWQSTIPLVAKGSLFAQLQAMAMGGGAGVSSTVAGATVGGVLGATYLREICTFVDETDPESVMGRVFDTSLTVVTTAIETKDTLQSKCTSSATCTTVSEAGAATVESISWMWDSFTTGVSTTAKFVYLRYDIFKLEIGIKKQKFEFGERVFDYMMRKNYKFSSAVAEYIYNESMKKVRALEAQIIEKESQGHSTSLLESKINAQKAEFGEDIFDCITARHKACVTIISEDSELEDIYRESLENINALDLLVQDREAKVAELA